MNVLNIYEYIVYSIFNILYIHIYTIYSYVFIIHTSYTTLTL